MSEETSRPSWAEEIRQLYLSNAANQFVVHGNINDRLLLKGDSNGSPEVGNLIDYLTDVLLAKLDLVHSYELGAGLRIESGEDWFRTLRFADDMPKDPPNAIGYLDQFLRFCVNLRALSPTVDSDSSPAGRNHSIAVIIKSSELVFPVSKQSRDYQLNSMASVVRSWSRETHFLEQNLAVFLLSENLNDLNHLLSHNQRAARVEIPMPEPSQ